MIVQPSFACASSTRKRASSTSQCTAQSASSTATARCGQSMTMATVKTNAIRLAIYKFIQLKQVGKLRWAGMVRIAELSTLQAGWTGFLCICIRQ
jgi:hypothetical protein